MIKRKHDEDLLLFLQNGKYKSCGGDRDILQLINFHGNLKELEKRQINYKVIENINIIENFQCGNNQYTRYFYRALINQVFNKILRM